MGGITYSYSAISSYENCPLQFKFSYIDRIPPLRRSVEAFMGSRVHEALEKLYRDKLYEKTNSLEEILEFYNDRWRRKMDERIFVAKDYDIENYRKMGERYLTDYYNEYKPFDEGRTIALEKNVYFPLNEKYWIKGVIDRLTERDDIYEVHDYKTSLYLPSKKEMEDDCQLALYALAVDHLYGVKKIELVWHFLAFNKEIRIRKDDYEGIREEVIRRIEEIEEAKKRNDFPPRESPLCNYCGHQPICPLFKHSHSLQEMEPEEIKEEDGFKLVNKYWALTQEIQKLEGEREMVKKQILEYAKRNGVQYIYGSDKIANVKFYRNVNFREKEMVEKIILQEGLFEKYSRLDFIKLSNDFKNGMLPAAVAKKLKEVAEEVEVARIYLRNARREED
ncbi:MAG: hypothetical protein DRP55_04335 [Spirochaetes bacterium]|nr:MAG: hypothetical protein DRP55_04335 [Spirochaetota bacterium]